MPHKVVPLPKVAEQHYAHTRADPYSKVCQLSGVTGGDTIPCSHFDHCERPAVIWMYEGVGVVYGFCQSCYDWCYPDPNLWYRVVKIAPEFTGRL